MFKTTHGSRFPTQAEEKVEETIEEAKVHPEEKKKDAHEHPSKHPGLTSPEDPCTGETLRLDDTLLPDDGLTFSPIQPMKGLSPSPKASILKKSSQYTMVTDLEEEEQVHQEGAEEEEITHDEIVCPGHAAEIIDIESDQECAMSPCKPNPADCNPVGEGGNEPEPASAAPADVQETQERTFEEFPFEDFEKKMGSDDEKEKEGNCSGTFKVRGGMGKYWVCSYFTAKFWACNHPFNCY